MSDRPRIDETLQGWLSVTRADEIDCDRFAELLAPWLDGRVEDPQVIQLLEHHRRLCVECNEEATLLEVAIEKAP
jgi:hypothetical protein